MFLQYTLDELGVWCGISTTRDLKTIESRVEHEGLSFLTISLPSFGKDFQKSLDLGYVDPVFFRSFRKNRELPLFLGGFLDLVFDRDTGRLVEVPNTTAIWAIRQITMMFAKINIPCSDARERRAIERYLDCEKEVRDADQNLKASDYDDFLELVDAFGRVHLLPLTARSMKVLSSQSMVQAPPLRAFLETRNFLRLGGLKGLKNTFLVPSIYSDRGRRSFGPQEREDIRFLIVFLRLLLP